MTAIIPVGIEWNRKEVNYMKLLANIGTASMATWNSLYPLPGRKFYNDFHLYKQVF